MASPWANALLFRLAGSHVPGRTSHADHPHGRQALPANLDQAFSLAVANDSAWQSAGLRLPQATHTLNITVDAGDGGQPQKRQQVLLQTGENRLQVTQRQPFQTLSRGQRWRSWARFLHTGEAFGVFGETLALATTLGAITLSLTGILLSFNRLQRRRPTRRA